MALSILFLKCNYAECCNLFNLILNVIMLNVIMLNGVMLNVIMLNVVMLNGIMLNVIMLNVIMLNGMVPMENANCKKTILFVPQYKFQPSLAFQ
jgi:hypothetical protein